MTVDAWLTATFAYAAFAILSLVPVLRPALRKIRVVPHESEFGEHPHFNKGQKDRLNRHYQRIAGTLAFWKMRASAYRRFHYYVLIWTIPSSVLIPVLTQAIEQDNSASIMVTVVSTWTAMLLAIYRAFKVDENFAAVRNSESGFYDLYRRLLDRPASFGATADKQIECYFEAVAAVRSSARGTETDLVSPTNAQDGE